MESICYYNAYVAQIFCLYFIDLFLYLYTVI